MTTQDKLSLSFPDPLYSIPSSSSDSTTSHPSPPSSPSTRQRELELDSHSGSDEDGEGEDSHSILSDYSFLSDSNSHPHSNPSSSDQQPPTDHHHHHHPIVDVLSSAGEEKRSADEDGEENTDIGQWLKATSSLVSLMSKDECEEKSVRSKEKKTVDASTETIKLNEPTQSKSLPAVSPLVSLPCSPRPLDSPPIRSASSPSRPVLVLVSKPPRRERLTYNAVNAFLNSWGLPSLHLLFVPFVIGTILTGKAGYNAVKSVGNPVASFTGGTVKPIISPAASNFVPVCTMSTSAIPVHPCSPSSITDSPLSSNANTIPAVVASRPATFIGSTSTSTSSSVSGPNTGGTARGSSASSVGREEKTREELMEELDRVTLAYATLKSQWDDSYKLAITLPRGWKVPESFVAKGKKAYGTVVEGIAPSVVDHLLTASSQCLALAQSGHQTVVTRLSSLSRQVPITRRDLLDHLAPIQLSIAPRHLLRRLFNTAAPLPSSDHVIPSAPPAASEARNLFKREQGKMHQNALAGRERVLRGIARLVNSLDRFSHRVPVSQIEKTQKSIARLEEELAKLRGPTLCFSNVDVTWTKESFPDPE